MQSNTNTSMFDVNGPHVTSKDSAKDRFTQSSSFSITVPGTSHSVDHFVPRTKLMLLTNFRRSTTYNKSNPEHPSFDPLFPKKVDLGPNSVGFLMSEIQLWIDAKVAARGSANQPNKHAKTVARK